MRFVAALQRFDDAHVDVIETDDKDVAIRAATDLYISLVPTILERGRQAIKDRAEDEAIDASDEHFWRTKKELLPVHGLSTCLQAEEWNITVYDTEYVDEQTPACTSTEVIFTIGALEQDSRMIS